VIAVQGLGYVMAHNWAYIAPFGCRRAHSHHLHRVRLDCWHGMILTAQPVLDEPLLATGSRRMI
jgi:hypothetical protein